ncbi:MAG: DUF1836 domain-containing protein [Clostridia bacterium]|nr:DUF1836 domain-containing protein [Clostridia bacterium]
MYIYEKNELIKDIKEFHLPKYNEIPNVGLYLEQTSKYISEALAPLFGGTITGSMISNYVKKGIVSNPVKKQYDREQIAHLIFISVVKNVLSMDNIKLAVDIQKKTYDSEIAYNYFAKELEMLISHIFNTKAIPDYADVNLTDEKHMLRNIIITVAHKIYLEKYFNLIGEKK